MEFSQSQTNRRDHTVVVSEGLLLCTSCHALPLWCYTRVHRMRKKLGSFALPSLREFVDCAAVALWIVLDTKEQVYA